MITVETAVENGYKQEIESLLGELVDHLRNRGHAVSDVVDFSTDNYVWHAIVGPADEDISIEISIEVPEAVDFDGEPADGLNFRLSVVRMGGEILSDFSPFNHTEQCWVRASEPFAVLRRWDLFAGAVRDGFDDIDELLRKERT